MSEAVDQQEPMKFIVGNYYTGVCTDVVVVKKGESLAMQFGFKITPNFTDTTSVFLGSDKVGKDGKTNDDRLKEDLISFGCTPEGLNEGNVMAHIRSVMIGKEIEVEAGEYKGAVQFRNCRLPGKQRGPVVVIVENPFGVRKPASGGGVF